MSIRRNALHRAVAEMKPQLEKYGILVDCDSRILDCPLGLLVFPPYTTKEGCKQIIRKAIRDLDTHKISDQPKLF